MIDHQALGYLAVGNPITLQSTERVMQMIQPKKRNRQFLLPHAPRAGYLTSRLTACAIMEPCDRQPVNGIVIVTTCPEYVVGIIDDIGRDGVSFYSDTSLDTYMGTAIKIDLMMYQPDSDLECYIVDELGWIVSSEWKAACPPDGKFHYNILFAKLSPLHDSMIERYVNIEISVHDHAELSKFS